MATSFEVGKTCYLLVMGSRFLSEIRGVAEDTIWVSFPGVDYPIEGMGVELEFHDLDGLVRYHTRVAIGPKEPGDGIVLQRAEAATRLKHRRSWRVPVDLPAQIPAGDDGPVQQARLLDLSGEGALLEAAAGLEIGSAITLSFTLPEQPSHAFNARIIHSGEAEQPGQCHYGLLFTEVSHEARESLTWFLWGEIKRTHRAELRELYPRRTTGRKKKWA